MNKKILAILMAMLMIAMSAVAFAAVTDANGNQDQLNQNLGSDATAITIKKNHSGAGKPAETFKFKVYTDEKCQTPATDFEEVTITLAAADTTDTVSLELPAVEKYANKPGENIFYIKETAGNYAGVTYSEEIYKLTVTVYTVTEKDTENNDKLVYKRVASIRKMSDLSTKHAEASFTNSYASTSMTVKKVLAGNAANMNDTFEITVTFSNPADALLMSEITWRQTAGDGVERKENTAPNTFVLTKVGHNDVVTFYNLPVGTVYSVDETDNDYDEEYSDVNEDKVVAADAATNVVVTNRKDVKIDTGVTTDNMPYIMLMAFAMMIAAAVLLKKRTVNE